MAGEAVGDLVVGDAVVGDAVVGDAVVGDAVVGDSVVGKSVGEAVGSILGLRVVLTTTGLALGASVWAWGAPGRDGGFRIVSMMCTTPLLAGKVLRIMASLIIPASDTLRSCPSKDFNSKPGTNSALIYAPGTT